MTRLKLNLFAVQNLPRYELIEYIKKKHVINGEYITSICKNCGTYFCDFKSFTDDFIYLEHCHFCND